MDKKQILIMAGVGVVGFLWLRSRSAAVAAATGGGAPLSAGTVGAAAPSNTVESPNATGSETSYGALTPRTSAPWAPLLDTISTGFGSLFRPVPAMAWGSASAPAARSAEVAPGVARVIPEAIQADPIAAAIAAEQAPAYVTSARNVWDAKSGLLLAQEMTTMNPDRP